MKRVLKSMESTYWLVVKYLLYFTIMMIFIMILGQNNVGLSRVSRTYGVSVITFVVVGLLFLQVYGHYDIGKRKGKPILRSVMLAAVCTDLVTYVQVMIMGTTGESPQEFRLENLELLIVVILLQMIVTHIFVYGGSWIYFKIHKPAKCLVITSSQESLDILSVGLYQFRKQYEVTKIVDYRSSNLKKYIRKAETVFIYDVPHRRQSQIMRYCYEHKVNVYFNPELEDVMGFNARKYLLDDIYLYNKDIKEMTMEQKIAKRFMDIVISVVGGIIVAPILLIVVIVIKLDDGGSIIFKQERATLDGKHFLLYKFRTMTEGATIRSAKAGDKRITRVGQFLRKYRIDEIPQLWNVLKGDMSVVGPRPEMIKNVRKYTRDLPEFQYRLRMKAGLTGYAQIEGKYSTLPKDKLIMDMMYMEQFTIWRDIQLMFQTVIVLLKGDSTEGFGTQKQYRRYKFEAFEE